jgi:hypothetical protein
MGVKYSPITVDGGNPLEWKGRNADQRKSMPFRPLSLTAALLFLTLSLDASAQIFKLRTRFTGNTPGNQAHDDFIQAIEAEIKKLQDEINDGLPNAESGRLMQGMANASVMAGKGIGSDYASNMDVAMVGFAMGVGVDMGRDPNTDSKMSGVGVSPGLILGGNLGFIKRPILGLDPKRLNLYFNFMSFNMDSTLNDEPGKESTANLGMKNIGTHISYQWLPSKGTKWLARWGGVKLHTGYEYNRTNIAFATSINQDLDVDIPANAGGGTATATVEGKPRASIVARTHSIPLEISTDVQLLYVLSLYTGLGTDISWGMARAQAALNATDEAQVNCSGGCPGGIQVGITPEANIAGSGRVNPLLFRGFAGLQFNIPLVRVFVQVDKAFGNDLIGATAGLRFVY